MASLLSSGEVAVDALGGVAALRHRGHRQVVAAGGAVAAGPDSGHRGAALGVDLDLAAALQRRPRRRWPASGRSPSSPGRRRASASRRCRPACRPLRRLAVYSSTMPVTLPPSATDLAGLHPVPDGHALGGGEVLLEARGVHLLLAAAVADGHLLGAEQLGSARPRRSPSCRRRSPPPAGRPAAPRGPRPGAARR
jgi:hypothetical protein